MKMTVLFQLFCLRCRYLYLVRGLSSTAARGNATLTAIARVRWQAPEARLRLSYLQVIVQLQYSLMLWSS